MATGVLDGFHVAREWVEYVDPMAPIREHPARYRAYFGLYKRLYEHLKDDYRELARLREAGQP